MSFSWNLLGEDPEGEIGTAYRWDSGLAWWRQDYKLQLPDPLLSSLSQFCIYFIFYIILFFPLICTNVIDSQRKLKFLESPSDSIIFHVGILSILKGTGGKSTPFVHSNVGIFQRFWCGSFILSELKCTQTTGEKIPRNIVILLAMCLDWRLCKRLCFVVSFHKQ